MAEYELPEEARRVVDSFNEQIKEHLANLDDFAAAIDAGGSPDEIVDDWEARRLLRKMPDDVPPQ